MRFLFYAFWIVFMHPAHTAVFTLKEALALAYQQNPEVQAQIDQAASMKGLFVQSRLYPNPELFLTGENIGGSGSYKSYESAETTLSLAQPIPLGHRLYYLGRATYADYLTSLANIKVQKANLTIELGEVYIDALYAEQWHAVTRKLITLHEDIVHFSKRRVKAGAGAQLDLYLAELRLGEAKITENKARREALMQRARLARFLGKSLIIHKDLSDLGLKHWQWRWEDLAPKINKSPEIIAKSLNVRAKRAAITANKKSVWPNLTLQVGGRHFSDDGSNALVVAAGAPLPVYDRNQGNIQSSEAQFTKALHELQGARLEVRKNLYVAFLQAEQSRYEADRVTESLLPLARKSLKVAKEGYQMGRYTYLELFTALNLLYEEERHYQQAHADYHKALIQIAGLLGLKP